MRMLNKFAQNPYKDNRILKIILEIRIRNITTLEGTLRFTQAVHNGLISPRVHQHEEEKGFCYHRHAANSLQAHSQVPLFGESHETDGLESHTLGGPPSPAKCSCLSKAGACSLAVWKGAARLQAHSSLNT